MTAAYKKKLEEEKQWLAEEKLREAEERKNDVVKKGHMGDFYRYAGSVSCCIHAGISTSHFCSILHLQKLCMVIAFSAKKQHSYRENKTCQSHSSTLLTLPFLFADETPSIYHHLFQCILAFDMCSSSAADLIAS